MYSPVRSFSCPQRLIFSSSSHFRVTAGRLMLTAVVKISIGFVCSSDRVPLAPPCSSLNIWIGPSCAAYIATMSVWVCSLDTECTWIYIAVHSYTKCAENRVPKMQTRSSMGRVIFWIRAHSRDSLIGDGVPALSAHRQSIMKAAHLVTGIFVSFVWKKEN